MKFHLGHTGHWDEKSHNIGPVTWGGVSRLRGKDLLREQGGRFRGGASQGERPRGLRAAGGGLSHSGGFRPRAPCLSGGKATSGGGSRRPGMAAWSPAAAATLLRGIRGVSSGRGRALFPGRELRQGRRARGFPSFLPFIHSVVDLFIQWTRATGIRSVRPWRAGGSPEPDGGQGKGHRHLNSYNTAGMEKAMLI